MSSPLGLGKNVAGCDPTVIHKVTDRERDHMETKISVPPQNCPRGDGTNKKSDRGHLPHGVGEKFLFNASGKNVQGDRG